MKSLTFQTEVTEAMLQSALPALLLAARMAADERNKSTDRWQTRTAWLPLSLGLLMLPLALLGLLISFLMANWGPVADRPMSAMYAVFFGVMLGLAPLIIGYAVWLMRRSPKAAAGWFSHLISDWSMSRGIRALCQRAPYVASYHFDDSGLHATIEALQVTRRTDKRQIVAAYASELFIAVLTREFFRPLRTIYVSSHEQREGAIDFLRAIGIDVLPLGGRSAQSDASILTPSKSP
jgi:hypothetical protein